MFRSKRHQNNDQPFEFLRSRDFWFEAIPSIIGVTLSNIFIRLYTGFSHAHTHIYCKQRCPKNILSVFESLKILCTCINNSVLYIFR